MCWCESLCIVECECVHLEHVYTCMLHAVSLLAVEWVLACSCILVCACYVFWSIHVSAFLFVWHPFWCVCMHVAVCFILFEGLCMQLLCCVLVSACWWVHFGEKVLLNQSLCIRV